MKNVIFILGMLIITSCAKTESTPTVTPPVVNKITSCDSIKQGLLKNTSDTLRLLSCLNITGCDSIRLGVLKPNANDTLRLLSCIKISGCDSLKLGILKANKDDTIRLLSCFSLPTISTIPATEISSSSAMTGGNITSNGGAFITSRGVCWSTSTNPTIENNKTIQGADLGNFISELKNLSPNTTYYVRSYATNVLGTAYGSQMIFKTLDYSFVSIGKQDWMIKNLDVITYRNGDTIPQVTNPEAWVALKTGAWCYYNNSSANGTTFGKLYNWYAVNDPRGLAPKGWHIPSDAEWTILGKQLGGDSVAGGKLKATVLWLQPNWKATNESGFTALPGGNRRGDGTEAYAALFQNLYFYGGWWSSTEPNSNGAFNRRLTFDLKQLYTDLYADKQDGFSVRCLRD